MIEWIIDSRDVSHPVPDQGQRPTCLAMATTGAHEHEMNAPAKAEFLSAEYLHWASGKYPGGRGAPDAATAALLLDGQPPASQWPYLEATDETAATYAPPAEVVGAFVHRGTADQPLVFDDLVSALQVGRWPVLGIRVTDAFAAAGTGIVLPDGPGRSGHAVLLVGAARVIGDGLAPHLAAGDRLLCVRNSWGSGWGSNGHKLITEIALSQTFITAFTLDPDPAQEAPPVRTAERGRACRSTPAG